MAGVKRGRVQGFQSTQTVVAPITIPSQVTKGTSAHLPDDLAPVKSFVANALALKIRGNRTNYAHIVNTIR